MNPTIIETLLDNKLCLSQTPNGTDKEFPKTYISQVYEPILGPLFEKKLVFVEIGVRTGASVHLWAKFFKNLNFIGIDNGTDVVWQEESWVAGRNVKYMKEDAYNHLTWQKLPNEIDVLIDDGPHSIDSQTWAASNYTGKIRSGGFLFIEDVQGGRRYCDRIIRSIPKNFRGCVRIFDLRKSSGEGDAVVVLIHNCHKTCTLSVLPKNELKVIPAILRFGRYQELKYSIKRIFFKLQYKLIKQAN
jgi:hypothetical protein